LNKTIDKLKRIKWHIWLRDAAVICVIIFAINAWQSKDMLDVDSSMVIDTQLLVGLDGQTNVLMKSDKPTLIYFFAPWCKVCSLSIGNLEYLNPDTINIVRVALDYSSIEAVKDFAESHNIASQILLGHAGLKRQFQIQGYPTYYILDKHQKIISKSYGYSTALGLKLRHIFSG
jgi:thiol-disulfide isomerase/thioredoxin